MVRQIKKIHRLWSKDLEQFYQSHQTTRRDYWNLIGYESEWIKRPLNVDFLNIKSPHFYIKKIQSQLYLKKLEPFLFKKMDILDFGGGIGRMITPLANNFKTYTLVETSKLQIEQAYSRFNSYENIEFYNQELESFNTNRKFDLILCLELLSYIENPNTVLTLLKKYLKPQGYILVSVENIMTAPTYYQNSKQKNNQDPYFPYTYTKESSYFVRPQNKTTFEKWVKGKDFKIIDLGYLFDYLEGGSYNKLYLYGDLSKEKNRKNIMKHESGLIEESGRAIFALIQNN